MKDRRIIKLDKLEDVLFVDLAYLYSLFSSDENKPSEVFKLTKEYTDFSEGVLQRAKKLDRTLKRFRRVYRFKISMAERTFNKRLDIIAKNLSQDLDLIYNDKEVIEAMVIMATAAIREEAHHWAEKSIKFTTENFARRLRLVNKHLSDINWHINNLEQQSAKEN